MILINKFQGPSKLLLNSNIISRWNLPLTHLGNKLKIGRSRGRDKGRDKGRDREKI